MRLGPHPQALLADARPASGRLLLIAVVKCAVASALCQICLPLAIPYAAQQHPRRRRGLRVGVATFAKATAAKGPEEYESAGVLVRRSFSEGGRPRPQPINADVSC